MINTNEADSFIMQLVINISLLPFGYFYFKKLSKKKMIYMFNSVSIDVNIMFAVNYVVTFIYITPSPCI